MATKKPTVKKTKKSAVSKAKSATKSAVKSAAAKVATAKEVVETGVEVKSPTSSASRASSSKKVPTMTEDYTKVLRGIAGWGKFKAILGFIGAGFLGLMGVPLLFAFGIGLIYIALAIVTYFISRWQWSLSSEAEAMADNGRESVDSYQLISKNLRNMLKAEGIMNIVSLVLLPIIAAVAFAGIFAAASTFEEGLFDGTVLKEECKDTLGNEDSFESVLNVLGDCIVDEDVNINYDNGNLQVDIQNLGDKIEEEAVTQ